nr:hypothetical protein [Tanacetum cinerariifolium]
MYNVDLKNVVLSGGLTCLFAKATLDESNLWHRRLGHINFKTMNKLVKGNLVRGNQPNDNAGIKENLDADLQNTYDDVVDAAFDVKENETDVYVSANGSDKSDTKKHDEKAKRDDKGKSPVDSPTRVRDLRAEFEDFSFNSTNRVNAVSAPVNAARPNPTNNTNSFNTASPFVNVVSLNFRIARKSLFVDPFKYPNDPDMPELEDIVYSDDEKDVGTEADLSNLETNIPVSLILTTGVHKDHPVNQIIGDLNLAPQTRSMTRMVKEQGELHQINDEDFHTYLPKGKRAIGSKWFFRNKKDKRGIRLVAQGHTQEEGINYAEFFAPAARIEAIRLFLAYASFMGFMYIIWMSKVLFFMKPFKKRYMFVILQDLNTMIIMIRFTRWSKPSMACIKLRELGLQVKKKDDGIFIHQDKHVAEILRKFAFTYVKSASTLIETKKPLLKDPDGEDVDVHIYRYLKGKLHLGLWYSKDSPFNLVAYFDSDYAGASLDRKFTTGSCQFLGCRLISWQCKKQTVVATSLTEAEYVAACSSCCVQILWIQNHLLDYG